MVLHSILDNDLYKFTMQQYVLYKHPQTKVRYTFNNRNPNDLFTSEFLEKLQQSVAAMQHLQLTGSEAAWLTSACPYFSEEYIEYLRNYRFNPDEVEIRLVEGKLHINIVGPWHSTILWEVPLMSLISEIYFQCVDGNWKYNRDEYQKHTLRKVEIIANPLVEFGTRRRRSYQIQEDVIGAIVSSPYFSGTSNVHFAHEFNVRPVGTMAHELIMALTALESKEHPNRAMLESWLAFYGEQLSIALTDTYGTESFFRDFTFNYADAYKGVRHDSGCPLAFADKVIKHYTSLGIDPMTKVIVFSDGLDTETCENINSHCRGRIPFVYGIGTNLTNDKAYFGKALNIVIKLVEVDGSPVVKLSDNPSKAIGDPTEVSVMHKLHMEKN